MNNIVIFFLFLFCGYSHAQELNCSVSINTQKLQNANQQVFKTLEVALGEFMNQTHWTEQTVKQNEKIDCSIFIDIASNNSNQFVATIQVQSSRQVYNSTYSSPILNYNDKEFSFTYTAFESLNFSPTVFESNLVSVLSFYSYIILGLDADSFVPMSGKPYLEIAQNIANSAQQSGYKGWTQSDGLQNRFFLINDLLSTTYSDIRQTIFSYHSGLDLMSQDNKAAKVKIKNSLLNLGKLAAIKPNAFLTRVFFDAKSDEIVSIFSGGPSIPVSDLIETLNKLSPLNSSKWAQIKF